MMAAARLDVAAVFVYAGSILPGRVTLTDGTEKDVTIIDAFEAVGACARGLMSREDVDRIERAICPGEGACGGMYTANTMASIGEAIGHVAARLGGPARHRPPPRRVRPQVRRGRRQPAAPGDHRAADHDSRGVRERHHRADGAGRLDERRAAPAGDGPRGRRAAGAGGLPPDRRQGAPAGRPEAVRPLRHDGRGPGGRRARGDAGAARRGPAARRCADRHRQDDGGEPGRYRAPRPGRQDPACDRLGADADRRNHDPVRLAGPGGRRGQERRHPGRRLRGIRPGVRAGAARPWRRWRTARSGPATS